MNSDLKQLIRLQSIDLSIQELRARVDKFPGISKALDDKMKSAQNDLKAAEAQLKEDQQKVIVERKQLEEENRNDLSALDSYLKERKEIEGSISPDLVSRYERVRKHRGGIGVAAARNEVCEICQVRIRPHVFQEPRKNRPITACDACHRI